MDKLAFMLGYMDKSAEDTTQIPGYRHAVGSRKCGNCKFEKSGHCRTYDASVGKGYVCDTWAGSDQVERIRNTEQTDESDEGETT